MKNLGQNLFLEDPQPPQKHVSFHFEKVLRGEIKFQKRYNKILMLDSL